MGIRDFFRRLLRRKEAIQAIEALQIAESSAPSDLERFKALQAPSDSTIQIAKSPEEAKIIEKDSFSLGFAAGYAGRALRSIEESLSRIESLIVTKDWAKEELISRLEALKQFQQAHDAFIKENQAKILKSLENLLKISKSLPPEVKTQIESEIFKIKEEVDLTPRMLKVLEILNSEKEISYEELAKRLGYSSISGIRGLLSELSKRTNLIERFNKNGKGWVRLKGDLAIQSAPSAPEAPKKPSFFEKSLTLLKEKGYEIEKQVENILIAFKNNKKIGVEIIPSPTFDSIQETMGNLIQAREKEKLDELLVISPSEIEQGLLKILSESQIKVFVLKDNKLVEQLSNQDKALEALKRMF